jgi:hypothetical protein
MSSLPPDLHNRFVDLAVECAEACAAAGTAAEIATYLEDIPLERKTVGLVWLVNSEVANGGLYQFFVNGTGDIATHALTALREAGLSGEASMLEQALAMFPSPYETDWLVRSASQFGNPSRPYEAWTAWDHSLSEVVREWDPDAVFERLFQYASRKGLISE